MINFKKVLIFKTLVLIVSFIFFLDNFLYSCPVSNNYLRFPIGKYARVERVIASNDTLVGRRGFIKAGLSPLIALSVLATPLLGQNIPSSIPGSVEYRQVKSYDERNIGELLQDLGYNQESIPGILDKFKKIEGKIKSLKKVVLKIDHLKYSDPEKYADELKKMIRENLWVFITESGYLDINKPDSLTKLLVTGLGYKENIFDVISKSKENIQGLESLNKSLVTEVGISQLQYIIFKLIGLDALSGFGKESVVNLVRYAENRYLFIDITFGVFKVTIPGHYDDKKEGDYYSLSARYRMPPAALSNLEMQEQRGNQLTMEDKNIVYAGSYLNRDDIDHPQVQKGVNLLWPYILIGDFGFTSAIHNLHAAAYLMLSDASRDNPELRTEYLKKALDSAIRAVELAAESRNINAEYYLNLGNVYQRQGKLLEAKEACEEAAKRNPRSEMAHYLLGMVNELLGNVNYAFIEYRNAVNLAPHISIYNDAFSRLETKLKECKNLKLRYQKDLTSNPDNAYLMAQLGVIYYMLGEYAPAKDIFEKTLSKNSSIIEARLFLGCIYYNNKRNSPGDEDNAIRSWSEALKLAKNKEILKYVPDRLRERVEKGATGFLSMRKIAAVSTSL